MLALCLASSESLYLLREELCTPKLYLPKSSVDVPYVGAIVEILLCEGRDGEWGTRTSKHILVFAIDPISLNSLSLFICAKHHSYCHIIHIIFACVEHNSYCHIISYLLVYCLASFILLYIHYMLGLLVCVPHLYLINKSFT